LNIYFTERVIIEEGREGKERRKGLREGGREEGNEEGREGGWEEGKEGGIEEGREERGRKEKRKGSREGKGGWMVACKYVHMWQRYLSGVTWHLATSQ
jgi:hypothetical protein